MGENLIGEGGHLKVVSKKKLVIRAGYLLDECRECPKSLGSSKSVENVKKICGGCAIYKELRMIGEALEGKRTIMETERVKEMTAATSSENFTLKIADYVEFKNAGMKDKDIAIKLGLKKQQLANWKYTRKKAIKEAMEASQSVKEKPIDAKLVLGSSIPVEAIVATVEPTNDWKGQFEALAKDYEDIVKKAGEMEQRFKDEIMKLEGQLQDVKDLHAACEDIESEVASLKEENMSLRGQVVKDSYEIENLKKICEDKDELLEAYSVENSALKVLVKSWI